MNDLSGIDHFIAPLQGNIFLEGTFSQGDALGWIIAAFQADLQSVPRYSILNLLSSILQPRSSPTWSQTMRSLLTVTVCLALVIASAASAMAQALGQPNRGEPGDRMIQDHLERLSVNLQNSFATDLATAADWQIHRPLYRDQYLYMLGLSPLPE